MSSRLRRIGLLPGSFNPPHLGHIHLAALASRIASLDACFFYVNSINAAKQAELIPAWQREDLLRLILQDRCDSVIGSAYFPDKCAGMLVAQEIIFLPLIEKLSASYDSPPEVWLIRGSDNFRPLDDGGLPYPAELCGIPHVIGIREDSHWHYDYSALARKIFVRTCAVSSSDIRRTLQHHGPVDHLIDRRARDYILAHGLFGTDTAPAASGCR